MSSNVIMGLLVVLFVALVSFIVLRRLNRTPGVKEILRVPFRERWRLGKLARSQQVISDVEDSRKAEELTQLTFRMTDAQFSPRHLLILGALIVSPRLLTGPDARELLLVGGLLLALAVGYLWNKGTRRKIKRTGDINGWDLEGKTEGT